MFKHLSWQKVRNILLTVIGVTIMYMKSMPPEENQQPIEKGVSTKESWQLQGNSAVTKQKDGKMSFTEKTVLIVPLPEEVKDLAARLQDLMRSWKSPEPLITNDYLIVAYPIRGLKIGLIDGGHGNVFTVNGEPVTAISSTVMENVMAENKE